MDSQASKAILIGTGDFLQEQQFADRNTVTQVVTQLKDTLDNPALSGMPASAVTALLHEQSNTRIKEVIATAVEETEHTLLLYYTGYTVLRKGKLFFSTPLSTLDKIYANGIALDELSAILSESSASRIILLIDARYIDADNQSLDAEEIRSLLEAAVGPDKISVLMSSALDPEHLSMTSGLIQLLQEGVPSEQNTLSLLDVHNHLINEKATPSVILGEEEAKEAWVANATFLRFDALHTQAKQRFAENNYEAAAELWKQALSVFPSYEDLEDRIKYCLLIVEARKSKDISNYREAADLYHQAWQLYDLPASRKGLICTKELLAGERFAAEAYEEALQLYRELDELGAERKYYEEQYQLSEKEVAFRSLRHQTQQARETADYALCIELLDEAMGIKPSEELQKEKQDCTQLLEEKNRLLSILQQQTGIQQDESLVQNAEQKARTELEQAFWKRTAIWNSPEAYAFYLDFFPEGQHREKANKRIVELKEWEASYKATASAEVEQTVEETEELVEGIPLRLLEMLKTEPVEKVLPLIQEALSGSAATRYAQPAQSIEATDSSQELTPHIQLSSMGDNKERIEEEEVLWTEAEQANTVEAYMHYINCTKASLHLADAYYMINKLGNGSNETEETAVEQPTSEETALEEDTPVEEITVEETPVEETIMETPSPEDTPVLEASVEGESEVEQEAPVEETLTENKIEQEAPVEETPTTPQTEATAEPSEQELWEQACTANSIESYKAYLNKTDSSEYIVEAYNRINQLNQLRKAQKKDQPVHAPADGHTPEQEVSEQTAPSSEVPAAEVAEDKTAAESKVAEVEVGVATEPITDSIQPSEEKEDNHTEEVETAEDKQENATDMPLTKEAATEEASVSSPVQEVEEQGTAQAEELNNNTEESLPKEEDEGDDEDRLWSYARREDTLSAYFNYLNLTKERRYWQDAKAQISLLKQQSEDKEETEWREATHTNTVQAYEQYIQHYPIGTYYAQAVLNIDTLKKEQQAKQD